MVDRQRRLHVHRSAQAANLIRQGHVVEGADAPDEVAAALP